MFLLSDNHPSPSVRRRVHAVLLSDKGFDINTLTEVFDVRWQTASGWTTTWRQRGVTGLFNKSGRGRPKKLTEGGENEAVEMIQEQPGRIESAPAVIEEKFGEKISMSTLKKIAGLSWKRVKKTLKNKRDQKKFEKVSKRLEGTGSAWFNHQPL